MDRPADYDDTDDLSAAAISRKSPRRLDTVVPGVTREAARTMAIKKGISLTEASVILAKKEKTEQGLRRAEMEDMEATGSLSEAERRRRASVDIPGPQPTVIPPKSKAKAAGFYKLQVPGGIAEGEGEGEAAGSYKPPAAVTASGTTADDTASLSGASSASASPAKTKKKVSDATGSVSTNLKVPQETPASVVASGGGKVGPGLERHSPAFTKTA